MRFADMTIRKRFALSILGVVVALLSVLGVLRIKLLFDEADREMQAKVQTMTELAVLSFSDPLWNYHQAGLAAAGEALLQDQEVVALTLVTHEDGELYRSERTDLERKSDNRIGVQRVIKRGGKEIGVLQIEFTNQFRVQRLQREIENTVGGIILTAGVLWLLIHWITGRITRPIYLLSDGADELAKGNLELQIPVEANDEIGRLASKFNAMAEKLRQMMAAQVLQQAELQQAHDQLEEKVEERTQELTAANEELRAVNEEMTKMLTLLQTTQRQLVEAEKMAALGNLVAGLAHEINTPVGVGVTASSHLVELLEGFQTRTASGGLTQRELQQFLATADETARLLLGNLERAAKMVKRFKQVAVDQTCESRRTFNPCEYLQEIVNGFCKKERHQVIVNCDAELEIDGFPGAFAQIVSQLLENSLRHAYQPQECGTIHISLCQTAEMLDICYEDGGCGVEAAVLPHIFEPFFTTRRGEGCSGLGLHVLYNIVTQQLHGTVTCSSSPERGLAFLIRLPLRGIAKREAETK